MREIIDGIEMKRCSCCNEMLPLEMFRKDKKARDGLRSLCKPCYSKACKKWYKENKEHANKLASKYYQNNKEHIREQRREFYKLNKEFLTEQNREYYQDNKERILKRYREYYQTHPEQQHQRLFAARLNKAVLHGKITKPDSCTLCYSTENIQGHHPSYEPGHELDVIWLCALCHAKIHIQLRHEKENGGPTLD